jgi:hypothetical protein
LPESSKRNLLAEKIGKDALKSKKPTEASKWFTSLLTPCDQSIPIAFGQTINGTLSNADCQIDDGSYLEFYSFTASNRTAVTISMSSGQFDTFLYLLDQTGVIATDDDGGGGTNSRITRALPRTGTYLIGANAYNPNTFGNYSLTLNRNPPFFNSVFDFDGDGKTDIGIFRPSDGSWWYSRSTDNQVRIYSFGLGTDIITPGDFTGDGKTDISIFRPSTGEWFIQRSEDNSFFSLPFGQSGDIPVPADYDGDGKSDAAVFRPSSGTWFILNSGGNGTSIVNFGASTDKPVPADFDGDGKADLSIFRPSDGSWWYLQSSNLQSRVYLFGVGTDKAVQGDYTGDGKADIAIWRPATGEWFVLKSEDLSYYSVPFGQMGDVPVAGDYDGDGKFDTGVFRPSTGVWYIQRSTAGILIATFGSSGDRPIPNAFVP